jgi:competence protein ComEA
MKKLLSATFCAALLLCAAAAPAASKPGQQPAAPAGAKAAVSQKLDLNSASVADLVGVPGIGPRTAQAIVDLRTKKGSFTALEDLLRVAGIKEKKLAQLAQYLEVAPTPAPAAGTTTAR